MGNCLKITNEDESQCSTNEELHSSDSKCKNSLTCRKNSNNSITSGLNVQQAGDRINENESHKICDTTGSNANHRITTIKVDDVMNYNNKLNHIQENEYMSAMKADGDVYHDCETGSSFAETWDPVLFDHLPVQQNFKLNELRHDNQLGKNNRDKYQMNNNLEVYKQNRLPLISTSILGFTVLRSDIPDSVEWLRNGEIENPKINLNKYLIKGKCNNNKKLDNGNENNTNADELDDTVLKGGFTSIHDSWLRYTMFIHQEKSDSVQFLNTYRKMKHIFLSLEVRTGCEIRMSRRLFLHKGKLVRTIVIDGPTRQQILRCYSSLPELLTRLMILECERPSETESRTLSKFKKNNERGFRMFTSLFQKPVLTA
ncbi:unnamed protein product [Trichobilharzia regenti]|uniref:RanBD1 domain-containing protein n=1 Tax=Trichobilharzia regenti TaxID=157069 RepID=A0A183W850_TRIRE|nr:unnamed protein product [Trichobilharzia regenti]VDQ04184.1 unnamed protein product [Trichobilharzia regenti]